MTLDARVDQGFVYRCTFCKESIQRPLTARMLGMATDEKPVMGKLYRYAGCYCGFGRFVICERTGMDAQEMEKALNEQMAH